MKVEKSGTKLQLTRAFTGILPKLCWHIMVLRHQNEAYQAIKEADACNMIVDFSENYKCGHTMAIQSSHFGASNQQLTLHTGVAYLKDKTHSAQFQSVQDMTLLLLLHIWSQS